MPRLEVYGHSHTRIKNGRRKRYHKGDVFNGSAGELKHMSDRLRLAGPDRPNGASKPAQRGPETDDSTDDKDLTVAQIRKMAEDLGVSLPAKGSKADLREILDDAIASM